MFAEAKINNIAWTPVADAVNREICFSEIHRLAESLWQQYSGIEDPSLFNGKTGIALYLSYYYRLFPTPAIKERVRHLVESVINDLSTLPLNFGLVNGISGLYWGLQHINRAFDYDL